MVHRLPLLQDLALREGTCESVNRAIRERLRVRLNRDPQSPARAWWILRVGQEYRSRQGTQRLRRRKEGQGPQKRHILVDTEGFMLKAKVMSAKVMDFERGSRRCCGGRTSSFPA